MRNSSRLLLNCVVLCLVSAHLSSGASLLHHWTFDEGSGSSVADTVGSAEMSISNASTGWTASGKFNGAYELDGTNHFITNVNDSVTNPSTGVAIAGWFRTSVSFVDRSYVYEIERAYGMRIRNSKLQVSFDGNTTSAPQWAVDIDDGLWHHFVAQNNGTTTELYVDGQLVGSRPESLASLNSESRGSAIGARSSGAREFAGTFDDVRYFDAVLTLSEIETLAQISDVPPTANNDSYTGEVDQPLMVAAPGVLLNDTEDDGDAVTASLVTNVSQGTLNLSADGSFTYTPPSGFSGIVSFTYQAVDMDGSSNIATVTLSILDPNASLTADEVSQIETDLGITLSAQEKLDLASIVKPQTIAAWRNDANLRIETQRKADLVVNVVDSLGTPIANADVRMELKNHEFKFGGVVTVMDQTDASDHLADAGSAVADWGRITKAMFNSVGLNNGFKPRIVNQHQYLSDFLTWAAANDLPVRGHLLLWPGTGDVDAMDTAGAIAGQDYGRHLTESTTSAFATKNVLGAVETYKASSRSQADKDVLKAVVDAEVVEWASEWDVFEWDVINETLSNRLLMDILGYDQMAAWFALAKANMPNPNTKLFINEFQLPSARFTGTSYVTRRDTYFSRIDQLITDGAPINGVGFQSRFRFLEDYNPAEVYARLEEFGMRYPNLEFVGTEFEVKDDYHWLTGELEQAYDEMTRAQVTEEVLTTYFSHDQVTGMNAWDFMNPQPDGTDKAYSRSLVYYGDGVGGVDGPLIKLNGLVWYYMHRIRYHSDESETTGADGLAALRGYKGEHHLTVTYNGQDYASTVSVLADGSTQVMLNDVTVAPTQVTLEHWPFNDAVDTGLNVASNVSGTAVFYGSTPSVKTDGSGVLFIGQDASIASGGNFFGGSDITIGARSSGVYELEFALDSVTLTEGGANGANVGFGFKDSANGADFFRLRLNRTGSGLALNTFFDAGTGAAYTGLHTFNGINELTEPLKARAVIDLDQDIAHIYMTVGTGGETYEGQVALRSDAVWDQLSFSTVNNSSVWGANDSIEVDYLRIRKLQLDNYDLWEARTNWAGETLTARTDDPDDDGIVNLVEYALGGDPLTNDSATVLPRVVQSAGSVDMEFTLGVDSAELRFRVQHSEDLSDWTSVSETVVNGESGQTIRMPLVKTGYDALFSRLAILEE